MNIEETLEKLKRGEYKEAINNVNAANNIEQKENSKNFDEEESNKYINQEIYILLKDINKTRFKERFKYIRKEPVIKFYLDDRLILSIDINTIKMFYCTGDLSKKVLKTCYELDGVYELKLFIEKHCVVSSISLPIYTRISRDEFVNRYLFFLKNEINSTNRVNLNRLNTILNLHYNEKVIKSGSKRWLTHITFKNKIENSYEILNSDEAIFKNSLTAFIDEYCVISNNIIPNKRLNRANFRKGYIAYCKQNNSILLDTQMFNKTLKIVYNETFIKSNGIYYMKKIKFKNFSK